MASTPTAGIAQMLRDSNSSQLHNLRHRIRTLFPYPAFNKLLHDIRVGERRDVADGLARALGKVLQETDDAVLQLDVCGGAEEAVGLEERCDRIRRGEECFCIVL